MMSAGIAHELNTPLAVLKGLVERLNHNPGKASTRSRRRLMLRVVGRLERLSDQPAGHCEGAAAAVAARGP